MIWTPYVPVGDQLIALGGAWLWDALFGEPPDTIHPVVWMGRLIGALAGKPDGLAPRRAFVRGALVAFLVPAIFWAGTSLVLLGLGDSRVLRLAVMVWLLKSTFARAALAKAALVVRRALDEGDLHAARVGLRSLCSRDATQLGEAEVAAGAIESVAENASDSVVAPLFFFALFGLPGAMAYRAINTADAMIGYRGAYEYLGKAAARLDDVANFIPARLTAALILAAGTALGLDARRAFGIMRRDAKKTESPNAGWPMAAMAGLLGTRLTKPGAYALGDPVVPTDATGIARAVQVLRLAGYLGLALTAQLVVWAAS